MGLGGHRAYVNVLYYYQDLSVGDHECFYNLYHLSDHIIYFFHILQTISIQYRNSTGQGIWQFNN